MSHSSLKSIFTIADQFGRTQKIPGLRRVFVLKNPDSSQTELKLLGEDATKLGVGTELVEFRKPADLERMRSHPDRAAIGAMMVLSDPLVFSHRVAINEFALRERLPTMHVWRSTQRTTASRRMVRT